MTARTKVTAVVVLLLGVGALLFALRACSAEDSTAEPEPSASPTASRSLAPVKMTTNVISEAIKTRLDENAGQPTRVECPEEVEQSVGTTFECDVFLENQPGTDAVSTASVEIDGPDGAFSWEATPNR